MGLPMTRLLIGLILAFAVSCAPAPRKSASQSGSPAAYQPKPDDQKVSVRLPTTGNLPSSKEFERLSTILEELEKAIEDSSVGKSGCYGFGAGDARKDIYGRDAFKIKELVLATLKGRDLPPGSRLFVRYGGEDDKSAKEETIPLGPK